MSIRTQGYVLVSAHHCAPGMGSEHAVGWNLISELSQRHALLVVTADNDFRPAIERGIADLRTRGAIVEVFFVPHRRNADGRRNSLRLLYYLSYRQYQRRVLKLARKLTKQFRIVAVHHITIVGFREPGFLWRLRLPFIWGPVGGLVYTPRRLIREATPKMRLFSLLRNVITWTQFRFSARVRRAYAATQRPGGAFIAATKDIGRRFHDRFRGNFHWVPETAAAEISTAQRGFSDSEPLALLWVGALIDRKPMIPLLDAIATIPDHGVRIRLRVIGDGDSRLRYEEHARRLNLNAEFLGWLPYATALECYSEADLFVLLSAMDLTTNVVFESLSNGVPVLCLDHHGYSHVIDATCGIKIPVTEPRQIRNDIAAALSQLVRSKEPLRTLSNGASRRAQHFTWSRNAAAISDLYPKESRLTWSPTTHPGLPTEPASSDPNAHTSDQ